MTIAARGGEGSDCCWIRGQYAPGRRQAVQNLPVLGKGAFRGTAWFDKNNILPGVNATMFNPVYGDMPVCTVYSGYKNFNGVKFPTRIKVSSAGFPTLDASINSVRSPLPLKLRRRRACVTVADVWRWKRPRTVFGMSGADRIK